MAALDVHTAKWIVDKCFKGDLLRDRTVLLVTHNVALASPVADFVVSLGSDGRILSQGTLSKALAKNKKLANEMKEETDELKKAEGEIDFEEPTTDTETDAKPKSDGKLIVAEEVAEGHVGWPARTFLTYQLSILLWFANTILVKLYFASLGGEWSGLFWTAFLAGMILTPISETVQTWFLGHWARRYKEDPENTSPV